MNLQVDVERLCLAHKAVRAELLSERTADGHWGGRLASSPLATASAISALVVAHHRDTDDALRESVAGNGQIIEQLVQGDLSELLVESVHWLARHQNPDGGWGDCERAQSNIAATMLVQAAFRLTGIPAKYADLMARADQYVTMHGAASGLWRQYGQNKTFVTAILANCALADMVSWRQVPTLPFELVCLPKRWQDRFPAPVPRQSIAAFVALGRAKHYHDPTRNPVTRMIRRALRVKSLAVLERLQAPDGGFLDSTPWTAFVLMCLASAGCRDHRVIERAIEFLLSSVRADASWPVENNRAIWNTTLALNNLVADSAATASQAAQTNPSSAHTRGLYRASWEDIARAGEVRIDTSVVGTSRQTHCQTAQEDSGGDDFVLDEGCLNWLLERQHQQRSQVTEVPPGGWSWSDSPDALPNTTATAAALLALIHWRRRFAELHIERIERAADQAIAWLVGLQNEDGGWPTFYRDGSSSFDASASDVTAHALRALAAWQRQRRSEVSLIGPPPSQSNWDESLTPAIKRGLRYLESQQNADGSFIPLWFGNEHHRDGHNPVYGTAQVLLSSAELGRLDSDMALRAARWLISAQHANGGWGPPRAPRDYSGAEKDGFRAWRGNEALAKFCSVEETALAVSALMPLAATNQAVPRALSGGLTWLAAAVEQDTHRQGAVLGFYPAKLWYHERLYPLLFAAGALSLAVRQLEPQRHAVSAG